MTHRKLGTAVALATAFATPLAIPTAHAELITVIGAGALVQNFDDAGSYDNSVPRMQIGASLGVNLGVTGANGVLSFGAPLGAWSLGSNGEWTGSSFVGIDGAGDANAGVFPTLSFDFGGLRTREVGAFMNFDPDFTFGGGFPLPLYIAAYDVNGTLLDSHELPVFTPGGFNAGAFYGIRLTTDSIARFEVQGPYAVLDNLSFATPVPEPSAFALLALGLGLVGFIAHRRRNREG